MTVRQATVNSSDAWVSGEELGVVTSPMIGEGHSPEETVLA